MSSLSFTTTPQDFPAGTLPGGYSVWILNSLGTVFASQTVAYGVTTATFTVAPGTYTASVQLVDNNGNPLGPQAGSAQFTITSADGTPVTLQIPLVITVNP